METEARNEGAKRGREKWARNGGAQRVLDDKLPRLGTKEDTHL